MVCQAACMEVIRPPTASTRGNQSYGPLGERVNSISGMLSSASAAVVQGLMAIGEKVQWPTPHHLFVLSSPLEVWAL